MIKEQQTRLGRWLVKKEVYPNQFLLVMFALGFIVGLMPVLGLVVLLYALVRWLLG